MKLLEVEGARAPVPHSWRRHYIGLMGTGWHVITASGSGKGWLGGYVRGGGRCYRVDTKKIQPSSENFWLLFV